MVVLGQGRWHNDTAHRRAAMATYVQELPQGALTNTSTALQIQETGEWVQWRPLQTENGGPELWPDGSFRSIECWFWDEQPAGFTIRTLETGDTEVPPTFALHGLVAPHVGNFLNDLSTTGGWDWRWDVDQGTPRSDPRNIRQHGTKSLVIDGPNVKRVKWMVRSADTRWLHFSWIDFYRNVPYARSWSASLFTNPSTTDVVDQLSEGLQIVGNRCWPYIEQADAKTFNPNAGDFEAWNRKTLDAGQVHNGQAVGMIAHLLFMDPTSLPAIDSLDGDTGRSIGTAGAAFAEGVCLNIGEHGGFGPFGVVPAMPQHFTTTQAARDAAETDGRTWRNWTPTPATDPFFHHPFQLSPQPRDAGLQADFGLTKYHQVFVAKVPTMLTAMRHAMTQELARPIYVHEDGSVAGTADGDIVSTANHPNNGYWDEKPFQGNGPVNCGPDPGWSGIDWLGKTEQYPFMDGVFPAGCPNTQERPPLNLLKRWRGRDRQHASVNLTTHLFKATGDPLCGFVLDHQREFLWGTMRDTSFDNRNRTIATFEADREMGRTLYSAAWIESISPHDGFRAAVSSRVDTSYNTSGLQIEPVFGGIYAGDGITNRADLLNTASLNLKCLELDNSSLGSFSPAENAALYWQQGIGITGLEAWHKVTGNARADELAEILEENYVEHGWFEDTQLVPAGGRYGLYHAVRFDPIDGPPGTVSPGTLFPDLQSYNAGGGGYGPNAADGRPTYRVAVDGLDVWGLSGVQLALERFEAQNPQPTALLQKARAILKGAYQTHYTPPAQNTWESPTDAFLDWTGATPDPFSKSYDPSGTVRSVEDPVGIEEGTERYRMITQPGEGHMTIVENVPVGGGIGPGILRVIAEGEGVGETVHMEIRRYVGGIGQVGVADFVPQPGQGNLSEDLEEDVGLTETVHMEVRRYQGGIGQLGVSESTHEATGRLRRFADDPMTITEVGLAQFGGARGDAPSVVSVLDSTFEFENRRHQQVVDPVGLGENIAFTIDGPSGPQSLVEGVEEDLQVGEQVGYRRVRDWEQVEEPVGIAERVVTSRELFGRVNEIVGVTEVVEPSFLQLLEPRPMDAMVQRCMSTIYSRRTVAVGALLRRPGEADKELNVHVRYEGREQTQENRRNGLRRVEVIVPRHPTIGVMDLEEGDILVVPRIPQGPLVEGTVAQFIETGRFRYIVRVDL